MSTQANKEYTQYEKNTEEFAIPTFTNKNKYENELYNALSPIFTDVKDVQAILDANWLYCKYIKTLQDLCIKNAFIQTCDIDTLRKYENICGIVSNEGLDISIRREQVLLRFNFVLPYTISKLKEVLNSTCGVGNWTLFEYVNDYAIQIEVLESFDDMIETLQTSLIQIIPAHIAWSITKQMSINASNKYYIGGSVMITKSFTVEFNTNS